MVRGSGSESIAAESDIKSVSLQTSRNRQSPKVKPEDFADFLMSVATESPQSRRSGGHATADDSTEFVGMNQRDGNEPPSEFGLSAPVIADESDDTKPLRGAPDSTDRDETQSRGFDRQEGDNNGDDESGTGRQRVNPLFRNEPESSSDLQPPSPQAVVRPRRLTPKGDTSVGGDNDSVDTLPPPRKLGRRDDSGNDLDQDEVSIDAASIADSLDPLDNNRRTNDKDRWNLTLAEAISLGLRTSPDVDLVEFDPAIQNALVGVERGDFDPVGGISFLGGQDDRLARSQVETFGSPANFQNTDFFGPQNGLNNFFVRQRLQNGGSYEFGVGTEYRRLDPVGLNLLVPSGYESSINFEFSQPLLRGRGKDATLQRLLVAKAQTEQSQFETQMRIREIVRNIELAYWELAGAETSVKVASKFVEQGKEFETQENERQELGLSARPQQLQTQSLLADFQVILQQTRRDANIAEMRLRTAMGVTAALYSDASIGSLPSVYQLPIQVDIKSSAMPVNLKLNPAIAKAMTRPAFGVIRARQRIAKHNLAAAKNGLLPQLNATALYQKTGLDGRLDESVSTLFNERFDTWAVGLTYQQSAYRRSAKSSVRRFQLTLGQERSRMEALTNTVAGELARFKADVEGSYETYVTRLQQVSFLTEQVEALNELYKDDRVSLFQRLEIIRSLQAAEVEAVEAWARMQTATADWRFTRGDSPEDYGVPLDVGSSCEICERH